MSQVVPDKVLDCTGLSCPLPVTKTFQAIREMEIGQVLELLATDPGVELDIKAWSRRTGNDLLDLSKDGDVFRIHIRRAK